MGNDAAINFGVRGVGSILDLNVAMPMMADNLIESILLLRACMCSRTSALRVSSPTRKRCELEGSLAMCTSLVPVIGYDKSAAIAKKAYAEGKTVRQVAIEDGVLSAEQLNELLDPESMTRATERARNEEKLIQTIGSTPTTMNKQSKRAYGVPRPVKG